MVRKTTPQSMQAGPVVLTGHGIARGLRRLTPVSIFVAPFGIAFGIAATEQGLAPVQAIAMSAFVFTATAQFAALDFLRDPVDFVSLSVVVLALSGRHIIMGAALSRWLNRLPKGQRFTTLALLSDANFADMQTLLQRGGSDLGPLLGGGLILWLSWVVSTAAGALAGDLLAHTDALGFGVVMVCFFAATAFSMVRGSQGLLLPVIFAMGISALTLPLLPSGWNIIAAAFFGGLAAVVRDAE